MGNTREVNGNAAILARINKGIRVHGPHIKQIVGFVGLQSYIVDQKLS